MGAKGAEPTETERLLFEAWMKGHCWMVHGDWDGKTYVHATERNGEVNYHTMHTRQLWAAWRDRAALAEQPAQGTWVRLTDEEKHEIRYSHMTSAEFIEFIEAKLKEKNT